MPENINGRIMGKVLSDNAFTSKTAKQVQLLDEQLNSLRSEWINGNEFNYSNVEPGLYVVKLSLSSGEEYSKVIDLGSGKNETVQFDLIKPTPVAATGWAITKSSKNNWSKPRSSPNLNYTYDADAGDDNIVGDNSIDTPMESFNEIRPAVSEEIQLKLLKFSANAWRYEVLRTIPFISFNSTGITIDFKTTDQRFVVIESRSFSTKLICCPPHSKLSIKLAMQEHDNTADVSVDLMSDDLRAESLLSLLSNGSMLKAESYAQASLAEMLLQEKHISAPGAAIGAYFLLKIRDYNRIHNWANNLADLFTWLPDGPIIHAWQMINDQEVSAGEEKVIRDRFLQAQQRGVPLYTEGVRLLYDGLSQLSMLKKGRDVAVENALQIVRDYSLKVDWSQRYTTIINPKEKINGQHLPLKYFDGESSFNKFKNLL